MAGGGSSAKGTLPSAKELGIDPRYAIEEELGWGEGSRVFRVADRALGVERALKLAMRRGRTRLFRSEFRRLSEMRHPNIVRSYGFGVAERRMPYYTLELVRGVQLRNLEERWSAEVLALIAMQVLDALGTIHARGWVHRDIKPGNLLMVGRGAGVLVRLIDLGLVVQAGSRTRPAGTLPYMAPEVARGDAVDGRADLYSLGVVLYEALVPEDAPATVAEVVRRFTHRPASPNELNPAIPAGLSAFVMRLMAPEPEQRYPDADSAASDLVRVPGLHIGRGPMLAMYERLLRGGAISHRHRLIAHLKRWATRVTRNGGGGVCVVTGARGLGKTPFLREVSMGLSLQGIRVMRLRANNEPGAPIPALLKAARALNPHELRLPDPGAIPVSPTAVAEEIAGFAGRLGKSLARSLGDRSTAIIIDDMHCANPVSLDVLRSLGHELRATPMLLIVAGDPRSDGINLTDALGSEVEHIELAPLNKTEIGRLSAHRLCSLELPPTALERLVRDSQGMPSLVERTLARLVADRTIVRQGAGFVFAGGRYRAARHQDDELVADRLAEVPPEMRSLLAAAAVLHHGINARTLAAVADVEVQHVAQVLAELANLRILNAGEATRDPSYVFASRSLRHAVYEEIPTAARRRYHDRAASVVAQREAKAGRTEERTEHLLKGSDDFAAVRAAVEAGDRAAAVYADRRAIEYHARAYSRLSGPEDPRAAVIALRLGRLFVRGGELERATVWYQAAITAAASTEDPETEIKALLGLGAVALTQGITSDTEEYTARALARISAETQPQLRARAHRLEALVAMHHGEVSRAEGLLLSAREELLAAGAERQVIEVLLDLARLARQRGEILTAVRYARRALLRARRVGEPAATAEALTVLGRGFLRASRFAAARRALTQALFVSRQAGDRLREASVLREIGNLRTRQADFAGALERYNRSLELARAVRARSDESYCLHNIGVVTGLLGRFRAALSAIGAALEVADSIGDVLGAAYGHAELGNIFAAIGALERAAASLEMALSAADHTQDNVLRTEASALYAWVGLRRGERERAKNLIADVFDIVADLEDPADRAHRLIFAGRCALRFDDPDTALSIAEHLHAEVKANVLVDYEASALGLFGSASARAGDRDAGLAALEKAVNMARNQGLRPLEMPLRLELGRLLRGSDVGAGHLTRAMEVARTMVHEMPPNFNAVFLGTPECQALRRHFRLERARALGTAV